MVIEIGKTYLKKITEDMKDYVSWVEKTVESLMADRLSDDVNLDWGEYPVVVRTDKKSSYDLLLSGIPEEVMTNGTTGLLFVNGGLIFNEKKGKLFVDGRCKQRIELGPSSQDVSDYLKRIKDDGNSMVGVYDAINMRLKSIIGPDSIIVIDGIEMPEPGPAVSVNHKKTKESFTLEGKTITSKELVGFGLDPSYMSRNLGKARIDRGVYDLKKTVKIISERNSIDKDSKYYNLMMSVFGDMRNYRESMGIPDDGNDEEMPTPDRGGDKRLYQNKFIHVSKAANLLDLSEATLNTKFKHTKSKHRGKGFDLRKLVNHYLKNPPQRKPALSEEDFVERLELSDISHLSRWRVGEANGPDQRA